MLLKGLFFLSFSLFVFSFKAFPPMLSPSMSWSNQSFRLWCRHSAQSWLGDQSRHPPTYQGSCGVHSWRSCWPWLAPDPAAGRWWPGALWMDACSPWRWHGESAFARPWTPAGVSCSRSPSRSVRGPAPYACMLLKIWERRGSNERASVFMKQGKIY